MTSVIPVRFAYAARDLWFDQASSDAQEGDHVICSTERGTEIGLAVAPAHEVSRTGLGKLIGNATLKPVLRIASDDDLERADRLARLGDEAMPIFRRLVSQSELDMKPVGVEYVFGGERVVCYFAAEDRVDFRQLVRDLSRELHQRIDMRQIGVREEAAVVGGFGHCGQELCCARFGLSFEPVSIRMAKEQDLPLTSNKISGACGRLMCCLRYEFEAYRDFKGRAPKRNAVIDTPLGKAKVVEYDTPKEQLALRIENGKLIRIPLAEMVASDAAVKKSEELKCPCRPDTVVRASLEKLNSPDVQMALAELDRKNGVVPADTFDDADIFVEPKSRKRRSRNRGADRKAAPEQAAAPAHMRKTGDQGQSSPEAADKPSRRRRRKRSGADTAAQPQAQVQAAPAAPVAQAAASEADKPTESSRRRRRHRTAAAEGAAQPRRQPEARQEAQATQPAKRRRRPGDRGGQKQQPQQPQQQKPQQPQQQKPTGGAEGEQKRRRRRRRRGGGNGNGGGQPAAE